jgi:hypothetical protein
VIEIWFAGTAPHVAISRMMTEYLLKVRFIKEMVERLKGFMGCFYSEKTDDSILMELFELFRGIAIDLYPQTHAVPGRCSEEMVKAGILEGPGEHWYDHNKGVQEKLLGKMSLVAHISYIEGENGSRYQKKNGMEERSDHAEAE